MLTLTPVGRKQTAHGVEIDVPECAVCGCSDHHSEAHGCSGCPEGARMHAFVAVRINKTDPAWEALLAAAREAGRPRAFTSDLFRDWQAINSHGHGTPFVWGLRELGTEIYFPVPAAALAVARASKGWSDRMILTNWIRAAVKTWPDTLWFAWGGSRLRPVDADRAVALVERNGAPL